MKKILLILSSAMFLTSCLKDKDYEAGTIGHQVGDQKIIELARPNSTANKTSLALDFVNRDTILSIIPARISSGTGAESDISITVDTSVTSAYVAANPGISHFKTIPGASVISPMTLTIAKGSLASQSLQIKVNPGTFNPSSTYVIGFKITSTNNANYLINANYHTMYVLLGAKNAYDGVYDCEFSNYHPSGNPGYTGTTVEVHMITTGADKVKIYWPDVPGYYCPIIFGGGLSYFGSQEPEYTINSATNVVTVQNSFPGAATFYTMNPTFNSRYEPATKTIYARFGYSYVAGNFTPGTSREWTQKLTYTGPR
jgi:Domain of unknown function (DUF1735)